MSGTAIGATDHRALLASVGNRLVRAVAHEDTPYAAAVYAIVMQRSRHWSSDQWAAACDEIDRSRATVTEFLQAEHLRARQ